MINELIQNIKRVSADNKISYFAIAHINKVISYLIVMKYLCEKGEYKLEELIKMDRLIEFSSEIKRLNIYYNGKASAIHFLLVNYQNISAKKLLLEFLNQYEKPLIMYNTHNVLFKNVPSCDYEYYDLDGFSTYISPTDIYYYFFKTFDEILGIKNKYIIPDEVKYEKYDILYYVDRSPKYRLMRTNNEYDDIYFYVKNIKQVILDTYYNKISNFKEGRIILPYLERVILYNDKAIMYFKEENNGSISIINYDSNNIKSYEQLEKIINNNRKAKNILIKTNKEEIRSNNMRIGFQLYQLEQKKDIQDINKIVDENTKYLKQLNVINQKVEEEINILLNK